jgi:ferric-dicitrate binding protein FerR (iron transport regulator)
MSVPVLVMVTVIMTSDEFNNLIDKYLAGEASPAEEKLVDEFLAKQEKKQAPQNDTLSAAMWKYIGEKTQPTSVIDRSGPALPGKWKWRMELLVPFILIVVIGGASAIFAFFLHSTRSADAVPLLTSATSNGQKSQITLRDGSKVFLNSASSISYPEAFEKDKREIMLSGEAFFEVTPDKKRPFIVHSGDLITKVVGTSFNIQAFEGQDIRVTVATGKVQVQTKEGAGPKKESAVVILRPAQQAIYNQQTGMVTKTVDLNQSLAWKNYTLYFDNNTLEEVAVQLERWYNVSIIFGNENVKYCRINGQYKEIDLTNVLKSIQYMYKVKYTFLDQNKIVLNGNGCNQ